MTGAAVIGLSLTYPNLEEVQTEKEGKGRTKRKKKPYPKRINIHKNHIHSWGWRQDRGEGERKDTKHKFSPEHSWIFLLNQMALDDNTRDCLY